MDSPWSHSIHTHPQYFTHGPSSFSALDTCKRPISAQSRTGESARDQNTPSTHTSRGPPT
uniref:Uncharacterized protein n=1 Tax=Manihot esculenta TaxID=3983 RepID=A0A2C9U5U8_MANES